MVMDLSSNSNTGKKKKRDTELVWAGRMAQVVEYLCSKCETLSSTASTKQKKKKGTFM
jgi:hypothetical protein